MNPRFLVVACLAVSISINLATADSRSKIEFIDSNTNGTSFAAIVDEVPLIHTSQSWPVDGKGKIVAVGDAALQTEQVFKNLDGTLHKVGSSLDMVAKLNVYLAKESVVEEVRSVIAKTFSRRQKPAVSFVVGDLVISDAMVAVDAVAMTSLKEEAVKCFYADASGNSGIAEAAVLPAGPKLYVSGMADTNSLIPATRKTLEKLTTAIAEMGSRSEDIVQLKVFYQPVSDFIAVRKEVADFFKGHAPPTIFVEWISSNPVVEIELIAAARGEAKEDTNAVSFFTPPGTTDSPVFRRVARVNRSRTIYISGLYGVKASDGNGQVREIFDTLRELTVKTGTDFEHLVKATYYVTDNAASDGLNQIRPKLYNPRRAPAASKVKVKGVGLANKTVTIDMIAVTK
jgi:enamine deaminase RidA (YjgF/YER057c/UK114 family)